MFEDLRAYTDLLVKHKITANQFLFLYLIHTQNFAILYELVHKGHGFSPEDIEDLEQRDLIINLNKTPNEFYADSFIVTDRFAMDLFIENEQAAQEFWECYPLLINIDFRKIPAKTVNKEVFFKDYTKKIGHSKIKHDKVMTALRYAIKNDRINMGIKKWFESEQWVEIQSELEQLKHLSDEPKHGYEEF
jgi:hypothetical protein